VLRIASIFEYIHVEFADKNLYIKRIYKQTNYFEGMLYKNSASRNSHESVNYCSDFMAL